MADKKITDLTGLTTADSGDTLAIVDVSAGTTKKVTVAGIADASWASVADGSVATADIADSAVTTAKVNNDAITDAKLVYGKVSNRQGGSATSWTTTGTTNYDVSGTNLKVQVGAIAVSANPTTVTFPSAFAQIPVVLATMSTASSSNAFVICTAKTATTASFRCINDGGTVVTTESINWIAIGEA